MHADATAEGAVCHRALLLLLLCCRCRLQAVQELHHGVSIRIAGCGCCRCCFLCHWSVSGTAAMVLRSQQHKVTLVCSSMLPEQ